MQRRPSQPQFFDLVAAELGGPKTMKFLDRVEAAIDWEALAAPCNAFYRRNSDNRGRPHWPVVTMVKVMMLRKWYNLSDVQTEEQILDRNSFRKFLGLNASDGAPDHSTIRLFNERLRASGLNATLFDAVLEQINTKGLKIDDGSLVDATIYQTSRGSRRPDGSSTADPAATKTAKGNKPFFGFRAHIRADRKGVIRDYRFDTARESEHTHFDDLVRGETVAVYADSGYMKKARSDELRGRGIFPGIMHRRVRGQAELTPQQQTHNRLCAGIRAFVEHPFGWLKNMGHRIRYRGVRNNGADFSLAAAAYNIKRMLSMLAETNGGQPGRA